MEKLLAIPILASFFVSLFVANWWIKKAKKAGFVGRDMHKQDKEEIAESGGIFVLLGFVLGVLIYIYIITFVFGGFNNLIEILALVSSLLIIGFIGFVDDIMGWKVGLSKRYRLILTFFAAVPLMVIHAGVSEVMGIEFGLWYPLLLIPIGIMGTTATFNFLAGYNGLEASQGILILSALALTTYRTGNAWLSVVLLCMIASLLAFYIFNRCPAKVFPGDALTYPLGALIGITAILGNIEKIAVFFFIPYIIEAVLKVKGKLEKESFAKVKEDGSLEMPYNKIYGLEHLAIYLLKKIAPRRKIHENDVVYVINTFQVLIILAGFLLFL